MKIGFVRQEIKIKDWDFVWETRPFRRSISIVIKPMQKIKVITGKLTRIDSVVSFLEEKRTWIEQHAEKVRAFEREHSRNFAEGESFLFMGQNRKLRIQATALEHHFIQITDSELLLYYPMGKKPLPEEIKMIVLDYYQKKGREALLRRANELSHLFSLQDERLKKVKKFRIKGQNSRWGSCTSEGVISLNWKLIAFSELVIDYVICHELAHLIHMNHSKGFWLQVAALCPEYRHAKLELKRQAHSVNFLNATEN